MKSFRPLLGLATLLPLAGHTQDAPIYGYWQDVVQFSDVRGGGSARMNAIQNAQTGLGGDISNASGNPAGLGLMRKSEFSFSPALLVTTTSNTSTVSNSLNKTSVDTRGSGANFNIGQLGLALSSPRSDARPGAFRGGTFAVTFARINNFNNYRTFNSGPLKWNPSNPNSYLDLYLGTVGSDGKRVLPGYIDKVNNPYNVLSTDITQNGGLSENDFEVRNAYHNYLIDYDSASNTFGSHIPAGNVQQSGRIYDHGYQNQLDFAYGFNLQDRLYLGGGIGIPILSQTRDVLYNERLLSTYATDAQSLQYTGFNFDRREQYTTTGGGFNAKIGGIYKVNDNIRVGLSAQTPTWYSVTSSYYFTLDPHFVNAQGKDINFDSGSGPPPVVGPEVFRIDRNNYSFRTPGNVSGGISLLTSKLGFLSLQGTLIPYSMARLGGDSYAGDNNVLKNRTQLVKQVRLGGEAVLATILRLRGGVAWLQNPVIGARDTWSYSAGMGVRLSNYFIDLSANVVQQRMSYQVYAYSPTISSVANNVTVQLTLGGYF